MKKINLNVFIVFALLLFLTSSIPVQKTTLQKLTGKTWTYQYPEGYSKPIVLTFSFTDSTQTGTITFEGGGGSADRLFYLSDTIETVFDDSKVGNVQNGKYIIFNACGTNGNCKVVVDEIISLTDVKLSIKAANNTVSNFVAPRNLTLPGIHDLTPPIEM
jgi:hypothetical protein